MLLIASGGLSHWLPSNDPRDASLAAERRASVIHGRRDVRAVAAAREPAVRAMGGDPNAPRQRRMGRLVPQAAGRPGTSTAITELGDAGLEENAGRGGHEIRTWLVGLAAVAAPAGVDELRAGAGVDHRHGHRHDVRGELTMTIASTSA